MLAATQVARDADRHRLSGTGPPSQPAQQHHTPAAHRAARRRPHAARNQNPAGSPSPRTCTGTTGSRRTAGTAGKPTPPRQRRTAAATGREAWQAPGWRWPLERTARRCATRASQVVVSAGQSVGGWRWRRGPVHAAACAHAAAGASPTARTAPVRSPPARAPARGWTQPPTGSPGSAHNGRRCPTAARLLMPGTVIPACTRRLLVPSRASTHKRRLPAPDAPRRCGRGRRQRRWGGVLPQPARRRTKRRRLGSSCRR